MHDGETCFTGKMEELAGLTGWRNLRPREDRGTYTKEKVNLITQSKGHSALTGWETEYPENIEELTALPDGGNSCPYNLKELAIHSQRNIKTRFPHKKTNLCSCRAEELDSRAR